MDTSTAAQTRADSLADWAAAGYHDPMYVIRWVAAGVHHAQMATAWRRLGVTHPEHLIAAGYAPNPW